MTRITIDTLADVRTLNRNEMTGAAGGGGGVPGLSGGGIPGISGGGVPGIRGGGVPGVRLPIIILPRPFVRFL